MCFPFVASLARQQQTGMRSQVSDDIRPYLSVVIPAYNEEHRLPSTLEAVVSFLESRPYSSEVIVVDDGSSDRTLQVAWSLTESLPAVQVLALPHRGKAAAVRSGVLAAHGQNVMFTDADLSTPLTYIDQLLDALRGGAGVAIGSREGDRATRVGEPAYRHLMGRIFNRVVQLLAVPGLNDTQCGFKAFTRDVAQDVFATLRLYDGEQEVSGPRVTGFDVEVLFVARLRGYDIVEVPVEWTHVPGSKVAPLSDSVRMFADVLKVRYNAARGRYAPPRARVVDNAR